MALHMLGTKGAAQLGCLAGWSQVLPPADLAAIGSAIISDEFFAKPIMGVTSPAWVLATATTAGTPALTAIAARAGSAPINTIRVGDVVLGSAADITPGTCVTAVTGGGTGVTLSQNAVSTGTLRGVAFVRLVVRHTVDGQLLIPGRGTLKILPGDVVAVDSTGWPILLSGNTISFPGSDWTFT